MIWRRVAAGLFDEVVPGLVIVHRRRPRNVVDCARAGDAGHVRRLGVLDPAATRLGARVPAAVLPLEPERAHEVVVRPAVGAHSLEALQRQLPRNLGMVRHERLVADLRDDELVRQPLWILEAERLAVGLDLVALRAQPARPELEGGRRADPPDDGVDHPIPSLAGQRVRILEERDVRARVSLLVGIEEVVDGRVVLVDRLLDHPQPEDARVEVDVPGRVGRDARDVVDAVESHAGNATPRGAASTRSRSATASATWSRGASPSAPPATPRAPPTAEPRAR